MNVVELIRVLQNKIATSTSGEDILFLTKVMDKLNLGMIKTVPSYVSLINIPLKETLGELYFVENEEKVYYRKLSGEVYIWVSLLGNEQDIVAYAWGNGFGGKLGDGTSTGKNSPVSVVGGFTDWTQVSAGNDHSLGVRANGTAWGWGRTQYGQLGINTIAGSFVSPVSVIGGFTDWIQVSASRNHSLGVRANGIAYAWGNNQFGKLGDGTATARSSPVSVVGGFTDWVQLSGGTLHSLGLRSNGTAWAWGGGGGGALGDNSTVTKSSPVSVVGGYTDWTQVSAGTDHSLGIRVDGTAWSWGSNIDGRLGDNSTVGKSSPVLVAGGFTDWTQLSAGGLHSLGVRENGTAWAWGNAGGGRLGDNSSIAQSSPVSVVGGFTDWIQLSGGFNHSLGIRANGTAWGWGPHNGGIGDGTTTNRSSPVSVIGGFTGWIQVSASNQSSAEHSLAIKTL
jgi:alpha-tubulin suppressor-like RCC1 family protein